MTDISTTTAPVIDDTATIPAIDPAVVETPPRPDRIRDLARALAAEQHALGRAETAEAEARAARERIATLEADAAATDAELLRLRTEQISPSDPRLEGFWDEGERIAEREGFCSEYDRLVDGFGGRPREREFSVDIDARVDVRLTIYVSARTEDEAKDAAEEMIDADRIIESLTNRGYDEIDVYNREASRE